jgi:hypothetical protein
MEKGKWRRANGDRAIYIGRGYIWKWSEMYWLEHTPNHPYSKQIN